MRNYNKYLTTLGIAAVATVAFTTLGASDALAQQDFRTLFTSTIEGQIGAGGQLIKRASVILGVLMILGALVKAYKYLREGEVAKKGVGELGYYLLAAAVGGMMWYAGAAGESGVKSVGLTNQVITKTTGGDVGW